MFTNLSILWSSSVKSSHLKWVEKNEPFVQKLKNMI